MNNFASSEQQSTAEGKEEEQIHKGDDASYFSTIDKIRAMELNDLSPNERSLIQEEIHGVHSMAVEETPEFIQQKFEEFDVAVVQTPDNNKPEAFHYALQHSDACQHVLINRKYHLAFLRAELFDVAKAVKRYFLNILVLYQYFGPVALQRPLQYSDLTQEDIAEIKMGLLQVLPYRDQAGRLIFFATSMSQNLLAYLRSIVFIINVTFYHDPTSQRLGAVFLYASSSGMPKFPDGKTRYARYKELYNSNPMRFSSFHICWIQHRNPLLQLVRTSFLKIIMSNGRVRSLFHEELSSVQCQYSLMTFGIPVQNIPITSSGKIKTKYIVNWLKIVRQLQLDGARGIIVMHPNTNDVLISPHATVVRHYQEGNLILQQLLSEKLQLYQNLSKQQRTPKLLPSLWDEIVHEIIHNYGGRLLVCHPDLPQCWQEVTSPSAQQTHVKWAWYNLIKRMKKVGDQQSPPSTNTNITSGPSGGTKTKDMSSSTLSVKTSGDDCCFNCE